MLNESLGDSLVWRHSQSSILSNSKRVWHFERRSDVKKGSVLSKTVTIQKEIEFDAGHRVPNHESKCRNPHGHRYRVLVSLEGEIVEEEGAADEGMLIDFSNVKNLLVNLVHDPLDHGFIVYEGDQELLEAFSWYDEVTGIKEGPIGGPAWKIIRFPYIPTAENLAIWIWEQLEEPVEDYWRGNLRLLDVEVYETPTSAASYGGE
jgi:6-pyruvoyltetrahydropterin/6-carboxytetrahydropterin synthase